MPIKRANPLDDLYAAVADHDLVVVPDEPLADALNRRLDGPHLGAFATTPRRLAAGRRERADDRRTFLAVVDETDLDWKRATYAVRNVLDCWDRRGRVDAILDYDGYDDAATRAVVSVLADLDTTCRRLADYHVADDRSVAVVGEERLTTLERSVLPAAAEPYDPFADEAFDLPPVHVYESTAGLVDALLDGVTPTNADDVAVVLDRGSEYSPLVTAGLEAAGVPFYGGPGFADDPDNRAFVRLLRAGLRGSGVTVGDVRPVLSALGVEVGVEHDGKRLDDVDVPAVEWLVDFRQSVGEYTFGEALAAFELRTGGDPTAFREELARLGIADDAVTAAGVDRLAFYLSAYEVPVDREDEGVLLADATTAAAVDRPVVFYLGLDEGWTGRSPRRPWVDRDAEFERRVRQFQLLLQNGGQQYYLVQDARGGSPVRPCPYFGELLDRDVERFDDLDPIPHTRRPGGEEAGFEREPVDAEPRRIDAISQSSLNTYVNCPREYFFDRILDDPERDYLVEGTLFHDFAEFCVAHPDAIDGDAIEDVVDLMDAALRPLVRGVDRAVRRTRYRVGLRIVVEFLARHPPDAVELTPSGGWGENAVADHFGLPVDSPRTERWFENPDLGVKGVIDLVHDRTRLLDYKSGSRKSATRVVKNAGVADPSDAPNYQALAYLAHWRTVHSDERLEFSFLHFLEPLDDVVRADGDAEEAISAVDLDDAVTTVTYHPRPFGEFVAGREAYGVLLDGYNDCVATFEDLGYPAYQEILTDLTFPETTDRAALRASAFADRFADAVDAETSADVDAEKGCDQAIRALNGVRRRNFFPADVDAFEAFVDERLAELNRRRAGEERFPVDGLAGEPNYRRVDGRDLLLEDDG